MNRWAGIAIAGVMTAGGLVVMGNPAWAACGLGANNPGSSTGTGSRSGCSGTVTLEVVVNKDVFGGDPNAGSASRSGFGNGSLTTNYSCGSGNGSYYTETRSSSGNKIQSGRVNRC